MSACPELSVGAGGAGRVDDDVLRVDLARLKLPFDDSRVDVVSNHTHHGDLSAERRGITGRVPCRTGVIAALVHFVNRDRGFQADFRHPAGYVFVEIDIAYGQNAKLVEAGHECPVVGLFHANWVS